MCHLRKIFLFTFCCLCVLGCSSSVWESDACKTIERHEMNVQKPMCSVDLPLFKPQKDNQIFSISESLTFPLGSTLNLSWFTLGDSTEMLVADEVNSGSETHSVALNALGEKKQSDNKNNSSIGTVRNKDHFEQCIDINTAEIAQLVTLPGIGHARAESIVQARNKRPFKRKKDITRIKGISAKSYQKMQGYLCEI